MRDRPTHRSAAAADIASVVPGSRGTDKRSGGLSDLEYLRILSLLDRVRLDFDTEVDVGQADPEWRMLSLLIRGHITGEPITISALIQASGVPYGTAQRRIHAMLDGGLVERRYRSPAHKSFFLAPSARLMSDFTAYVTRMKAFLAQVLGARGEESADEFYFGGPQLAREIAAPARLQQLIAAADQPLRFLLNDDNYFAAMRNMWSDYRNNLGARKGFSLYPLPDLHAALAATLSAERGTHDVVALNIPWLGEFASTGQLRDLGDMITEDNIRPHDFDPAVWSTGRWNDRQYGLPIYITVEAMALRRDLFEARGIEPPRTFDEVIEAGRRLHDPAREFYGIAWNAARGMPIASTFMILMGCCGASILNLTGAQRFRQWASLDPEQLRPRIDCDEARQVMDYMRRLVAISPPDILEMDWDRRVSAFLNGEVAMAYCWSMRAARFDGDVRSVVKRRTRFIPQPKSAFGASNNPVGGFLLAIPANVPDARAEIAFEAISWMASPQAMKTNVANGLPVAPRFSVAADPEVARMSPIVRFVEKLAQRKMLCTWQRPPIPEYRQIETILGNRIHAALAGEATVDAALAQAQAEVDRVLLDARRR